MSRIPFGYFKEDNKLQPFYHDLRLLEEVKGYVDNQAMSLREARDYINAKAYGSISHEGLKQRLSKGVYTHGGSLLTKEDS